MNWFTTIIVAVDPYTKRLTKYGGPNIQGISMSDAQHYCDTHGLGYCKVDARLVAEIPCKKGSYDPDFENRIDYDHNQN